jgi:type IV pilus assembly protein PilF
MLRRMRVWPLVWVALCLGCLGCGSTTGKSSTSEDPLQRMGAEELREMGEKFLATEDTANALRYLTASDQKQPNDPHTLYDLGDAYDARGTPEKALEYFRQAATLKPDYSEAHNAVAKIYAEQGRTEEALQEFEQALVNPFYNTPHLVLYNMGLLYERQSNWQMAQTYYQRALQANRNYAPAYYRTGKAMEATGRPKEAREAYAKAIEHSPNMVEAHYDFARLSYEVRDYNGAYFSFTRVVKLAPNSPMALEAAKYVEVLEAAFPR